METYFPLLYNYGMRFSQDQELIKDVIQDLFLTIWKSRENLNDNVNVKAYIICSFRRALHKKIASPIHIVSITNYPDDRYCFDFGLTVEDDLIKKETVAKIASTTLRILNSLPARQKEVVYLNFFTTLTRNEISEALGIAPQTVSNILQMALNKLRSTLDDSKRISV